VPLIRQEQPADFDTVNALLQASFGREAEARLVDRLRASGKIFSALLAEENQRILGYIVVSAIAIDAQDGETDALALAPLAVEPAFNAWASAARSSAPRWSAAGWHGIPASWYWVIRSTTRDLVSCPPRSLD
jgi:hypothetical protein